MGCSSCVFAASDRYLVWYVARAGRLREVGVRLVCTGRAGNVVEIRPPLVCSRDNTDFLAETFDRVLRTVEPEPGRSGGDTGRP